MDKYIKNKMKLLKTCKNTTEIEKVLNKIYEDGFEDGANEGKV